MKTFSSPPKLLPSIQSRIMEVSGRVSLCRPDIAVRLRPIEREIFDPLRHKRFREHFVCPSPTSLRNRAATVVVLPIEVDFVDHFAVIAIRYEFVGAEYFAEARPRVRDGHKTATHKLGHAIRRIEIDVVSLAEIQAHLRISENLEQGGSEDTRLV